MQVLPEKTEEKRDAASLVAFLQQCQALAKQKGRTQFASISLEVKFMDPLAVLQSIYEDNELHFYLEHPSSEEAVAGAEAVAEATFSGPARFQEAKKFAEDILANTVIIGDTHLPFSGPHFFTTFTFDEASSEPFPAARIFLPRWQVSKKEGQYTAVANLPISPDADIEQLAKKVLGAHQKFNSFEYDAVDCGDSCNEILHSNAVGGETYYKEAVQKAHSSITDNGLQKVVLARALDLVSDAPFDPFNSLNRIREKYPLCFPCSTSNAQGQTFICAAPERLLKIQDNTVYTEAVAGSEPRGKTAKQDAVFSKQLLNSKKDLHEHKLVLDYITSKLIDLGMTPKTSAKPRLKQLANVQHLVTSIEAPLSESTHFLDVAEQLHPTPAVGGSPLKDARESIAELENFDRGLYGGALGYFDHHGNGELVVGIRSALINKEKARLYAGSGIVKGSDAQKEFLETELKLQALLNHLR